MLLSALPTSLLEAKAEAAGLRLELFNLSQQQSDVEALQRNQTELADAFERWSLELDKPEVARLAPCSSRPPNTTVHMRLDNYDKCDIVSRMGAITLAVGGSDRSHGGGAPVTLPLPLPLLSFAEEDLHPLLCEIARLRLMLHHMYPLDRRNSLTARRQELFDASSLDATCHFLKSVEGRGLALVLTDGAGTILHANRAWEVLCGYKLIEVRGHTSHFLQGPKTDPEVVAIVNSRFTRGEGSRSRVVNYRKDGTAFENSVEVVPIFDGGDGCFSEGCRSRPSHFIARLAEIKTESDIAWDVRDGSLMSIHDAAIHTQRAMERALSC